MIPKLIHYCWLSNDPLPADIQAYIDGWKKLMPDYEIVKWDTNHFDVNSVPFVKQAFEHRKWAFAADYIRAYALYNQGGIYLDSDVETLKRFDDFLSLKMMLGYENTSIKSLEVAVWGAEKGHPLLKELLDLLNHRQFLLPDGSFDTKPLPMVVRDLINAKGFKIKNVKNVHEACALTNEIPVFPYYYFSPLSHVTMQNMVTKESYSIHHFKASWLPKSTRKRLAVIAYIKRNFPFAVKIVNCLKKLFGGKVVVMTKVDD